MSFRTAGIEGILSVKQHERYWHARLDVTISKREVRQVLRQVVLSLLDVLYQAGKHKNSDVFKEQG